MKLPLNALTVCWLLLAPLCCFCQDSALIQNPLSSLPDTLQVIPQKEKSKVSSGKMHIPLIVIPAAAVVYGAISLKSDGLQDWNEGIKEEIWTEKPHKQFHIDNYLQFAPAVAVYGLNLVGIKGKHNLVDRTMIYGISTVIMGTTVYGLKKLSGEWRPDASDRSSFPSGHTATAFAAAEFLRQEYQDVSIWYGIAGYTAAAVTGYLRMYNNKHWLSDVVAGAGIGIISTNVAYKVYPLLKKAFSRKEKSFSTMIAPYYNGSSGGISLVHHF